MLTICVCLDAHASVGRCVCSRICLVQCGKMRPPVCRQTGGETEVPSEEADDVFTSCCHPCAGTVVMGFLDRHHRWPWVASHPLCLLGLAHSASDEDERLSQVHCRDFTRKDLSTVHRSAVPVTTPSVT